jgi:hypothetical protein
VNQELIDKLYETSPWSACLSVAGSLLFGAILLIGSVVGAVQSITFASSSTMTIAVVILVNSNVREPYFNVRLSDGRLGKVEDAHPVPRVGDSLVVYADRSERPKVSTSRWYHPWQTCLVFVAGILISLISVRGARRLVAIVGRA